ncbi:MAG: hypothetical protein QW063_01500 [Candidatus Nanoarchaeia archaeon]
MKIGHFLILVLLTIVIFISGCIKQSATETSYSLQAPDMLCIAACKEALDASVNLENGPCLLDPIPQNPNWVCDVAHSPRQAVDNLPENQCSAFRNGTARHFIEVTPSCELIRQN